ncbi:MAG TPA: aminotransferase class III-fold pyridoxal phosphate-dependent enzyme [Actinomycetota bacterium]|nr:aminotransferase class III-fold pyridoxal phosphate-dependent enzyme [Actinomycetota bacterium]
MAVSPEQVRTWLERDADAIGSVLARMTDIVAASGEGSWLTDVEGRRYLDFACGIAVTNLGHCHPDVVAAVERQVRTLVHTSVVARHAPGIECAERLIARTPFIDDPRIFFCNTGAEAVEGAIKLARRTTGRPGIVAFRGGFHGRTMGAVSLTTAKDRYREGYDPLLPGVSIAPFCHSPEEVEAALAALDELLDHAVAAMVVEPVLGEGGYVVPPVAWLRGLRERADRHGVLLVFDEVQTGAGRTGRWFAAQTHGVHPDVVLFAKGVANGFPLGGIVASRELFDRWPTATHGTTFGGNPVSCAAAVAVMDVVEREALLPRVRETGPAIVERLRAHAPQVRGLGYMVGVELSDAEACARVRHRCLEEGLLVLSCGPRDSVLRLIPPLNASDAELEMGLQILVHALGAG